MDKYIKAEDQDGYFPEDTIHEDDFFYTGNFSFVWDKAKNEKNLRDHGIDFRTAALVFNDPYALEESDNTHSKYEERNRRTGIPVNEEDTLDFPGFEGVPRALMGEIDNVLFVVFITRFMKNDEYYRIISARVAVKKEIEAYKRNRARFERRQLQ